MSAPGGLLAARRSPGGLLATCRHRADSSRRGGLRVKSAGGASRRTRCRCPSNTTRSQTHHRRYDGTGEKVAVDGTICFHQRWGSKPCYDGAPCKSAGCCVPVKAAVHWVRENALSAESSPKLTWTAMGLRADSARIYCRILWPCLVGALAVQSRGGIERIISFTMDFKPSVSVLFGHYSLPRRRILTKLGRAKFEKTT